MSDLEQRVADRLKAEYQAIHGRMGRDNAEVDAQAWLAVAREVIEMAWRAHAAGLDVTEVPITFTERQAGASKLGTRVVAEAMWLVTRWGVARRLGRATPVRTQTRGTATDADDPNE